MRPGQNHPTSAARPACFGSGVEEVDLYSRQGVSLETCRACEHVSSCSLLRQARATEDQNALGRVFLEKKFPFGQGRLSRLCVGRRRKSIEEME
jgi:hypothetical protein